ncbi:MAG: DUF87 domain-containing protein [Kiritimatiellae bacterium]|nr:DUF87 domain-containing protein [Kiritimatiellia bacterium]
MQDFEKLGVFYLGKEFDPAAGAANDHLILYDAKDLTTHATIVGMTGSGKTGLALALLEEAAIDGIPAILIDPKGDLGNLLLQFPELQPSDFRPWIDESEAARKGMTPDDFAAKTAQSWAKGLEASGQDGERIRRLKDSVEWAVYTPGNTAGRPLQILRSWSAPPPEVAQDSAALRDRIMSAVSGLLGLLGIAADPVQSPEHILLSHILDRAWREGRDMDLAGMIANVQKPPFDKIGVFDLETFYPAKDRMRLAMSLNNLLASPGFSAWMEGEPLHIQRLLFSPDGRPRISVLYIAHLSEAERMFFVTILLNEVLSWMRTQSGTGSLRALLYMDEIFGYFPPTANPPSKLPMLTLLKQARAYGLGVVLSTQNPVDLDYKGLSNCGTWFIGRLQTERDKMRVIEGLEGAAASTGGGFDRAQTEQILAGLGNRVFLMRNAHDTQSVIFQTRWVMSYLRGPLTMPQLRSLTGRPAPAPAAEAPGAPTVTSAASGPAAVTAAPEPAPVSNARPALPPDLSECFLRASPGDGALQYRPGAIAACKLHFVDATSKTDTWVTRTLWAPLSDDGRSALWDEAEEHGDLRPMMEDAPAAGAGFAELPAGAVNARNADAWRKGAAARAYQSSTLDILRCAELKMASSAGESEGDFRARLAQALREQRDLEVAKLKAKYAPKLQTLGDQLRRAEERVAREKSQSGQQKLSTALSVGATLLGALLGRGMGVGTVGRAATAAKSAGKIGKEQAEVRRAVESAELLQQRLSDLEAQFEQEVAALQTEIDPAHVELASTVVRPRKSDITFTMVGIGWIPWRVGANGAEERAI